jgi:hypothetical protein
MKILFALVVSVCGGALFAQPYYTAYQMREAADARDHALLSTYIDFPAVRASLKDQGRALAQRQVEQEVGRGALAELGGALGSVLGERMVEATITPETLAALMQAESRKPSDPDDDAPIDSREDGASDPDVRLGYTAWDRFVVDVIEDDQITRMVLGRQGLAWKLVAVELR